MGKFRYYYSSVLHYSIVLHALVFSLLSNTVASYSPSTPSLQTTTAALVNENTKDGGISVSWLIVGGGIHGVHIATRLLAASKNIVPAHQHVHSHLCIIDENENLLQKWKSRTANTGMEYLRSPAIHHLDVDERSLRRQFAAGRKAFFAKDYERPRLDVFNQHCDSVIQKYNLNEMHQQGRVTSIEPKDDHVRVQVSNGSSVYHYNADNVVLALGNDKPSYAEWVHEEDVKQGLVRHLLDDDAHPEHSITTLLSHSHTTPQYHSIAVVGGGITAAHKALELVKAKKKTALAGKTVTIHLISRHALKEQQFDTHQDWMMDRAASKRSEKAGGYGTPKRQRMFAKLSSYEERRRIITKERVSGTVTPAVSRGANGLRYAVEQGYIQWHQAEITETERCGNCMKLSLSSGKTIQVNEILLATGFGKKLPGGKLINDLVEKVGLKVSNFCGYPILSENLSWSHPRIFVAGALAELELGPSARNIAGARLAAERIVGQIMRL
mmetsp:Transcript_51090/g.74731  ORF Transcript_51090/g.74731 Transcript_51090/m.74731 type:complete len:497 (-) Transcript_51090:38-1528(-)